MVGLGFAKPNTSRLRQRIQKSKEFWTRHSKKNTFRLSIAKRGALRELYPDLSESEEVVSDDSLLPEVLFDEAKRRYLKKIVQQINSSYENNLFDACALLMRRLLEILSYSLISKPVDRRSDQRSRRGVRNLNTLINKAMSRKEIGLSAPIKKNIDQFRKLGNLSCTRITYNCRKDDIRTICSSKSDD